MTAAAKIRTRRRIIERPRLCGLLDRTGARLHVLTAPAGYGKTTLADQWIAADGRVGAWFRARRSSRDVAALALDVARACATIVPGCDERLRAHLRAVAAPGERPDVLAELVGEELADWPPEAWLVIDEYQELVASPDSELFIESLIDVSQIQLLVASRQRPAWATQKRILSGQLFELGQNELAMTEEEAAEVLAGRNAPSSSWLLSLADGWPAVIGLASVSPEGVTQPREELEAHEMRASLYRFFAEEIFTTFDESVQRGLMTLSIAPVIDAKLATELLGNEVGAAVCTLAVDVGIMVERGSQLELHPLARSFLIERATRTHAVATESAEKCVAHYRNRGDWPGALDLITRFELRDQLVPTLDDAMNELLDAGQLSTIEEWCETARQFGADNPLIALARAEIALRHARLTEAQTHGEAAARVDSPYRYRALTVASRAAHLSSREDEAVELAHRAEVAAPTEADRREAQWFAVSCLLDLESPEAEERLAVLRSSLVHSSARDMLTGASVGLAHGFKSGCLSLDEADRAVQLLTSVPDPLAQSSFLCLYSTALSLATQYSTALVMSEAALRLVEDLRLDFGLPYALHARASARAGLREWSCVEQDLDRALIATRAGLDAYGVHICLALKIRSLVQQGHLAAALAIEVPTLQNSLRSGRAEALGSRAFALAVAARLKEASRAIDEARGLSTAVEPIALTAVVDAIVSLRRGSKDAADKAAHLVELTFERGALDFLVAAYRSTPDLLRLLLGTPDRRDDIISLLSRAGDLDLAEALGQRVTFGDPTSRLSRREHEILLHLQDGMTNAQIAATLVLSEGTVKVHVHNILEKLGLKNRQAIVFQAMLARTAYATSAIDRTDASGDASEL